MRDPICAPWPRRSAAPRRRSSWRITAASRTRRFASATSATSSRWRETRRTACSPASPCRCRCSITGRPMPSRRPHPPTRRAARARCCARRPRVTWRRSAHRRAMPPTAGARSTRSVCRSHAGWSTRATGPCSRAAPRSASCCWRGGRWASCCSMPPTSSCCRSGSPRSWAAPARWARRRPAGWATTHERQMGVPMLNPQPAVQNLAHQRRSRRPVAVAIAGVALAALGWLALRGHGHEAPVAPEAAPPSDVVTLAEGAPQWAYLELAVAEEQPELKPPPAPGRVEFDEKRSAAAGSPLPGRVEEVRVRLGDQVKAGDRLIAVRSGALADLGRDLESARSEVAAKTRVAERARELVALRAAPEKEQLAAEEDLRQAQLALKAANAKRDSLNATIDGDTRFWITAPQNGTVVELAVSAGQE